jgi:glycosyltransferase involved in cell wall biosynthesis
MDLHEIETNCQNPFADHIAKGKHIVLISHGFQTNYERGFTNGLADNGIDVTLISSDQTDRAGLRQSVHTLNLRGSQAGDRPKWLKLVNLLRYHFSLCTYVLRRRGAVFHVMGLIYPPFTLGILEGIWFRTFCKRYVLTVHDLLPHDLHTRLNYLFYGWSFRLAHRLVVHTELMRDELNQRYGISLDRITVMEHGIEPLSNRSVNLMPFRHESRLRLLVFGVIKHYKGIDVLLEALRDFPIDFQLTIAGFCPSPSLALDLRTRIDNHPAANSITWLNQFVPESEVAEIFKQSDVLILPYRQIDQSGVLFQAFRYGVPVVATRVGSFEHYVTSKIGETCVADSADALRHALERLVARYQNLCRETIVEIGQRYEWQKTVRKLSPVYDCLA